MCLYLDIVKQHHYHISHHHHHHHHHDNHASISDDPGVKMAATDVSTILSTGNVLKISSGHHPCDYHFDKEKGQISANRMTNED